MSNYREMAYNPTTRRVEVAEWMDNYLGPHAYAVSFNDGGIFSADEVGIEAAGAEIERLNRLLLCRHE